MFWADEIAEEVIRRYSDVIAAGKPLIIRDEKTASGQVHVGSLRSAALHAMVADALTTRGVAVEFQFEINDFDPMDGIPAYLDTAEYQKYMGVQLYKIPSPEAGFANFAELYGQEYVNVLERIGFKASVYRASELYRSGAMNEVIKKALERRAIVRDIYKRVSGSEKKEDWYPFNVACEQCGNLSATVVTDFDGETVAYTCEPAAVDWAKGCGHSGRISPFDGNGKLPWKLDWAGKFVVKGVHFEGGGKDHYTKGGSRQVAEAIAREVFDHEPPYGVFNEFFLIGGKKMSSSKGNAATAVEMANLLPTHLLRFLLIKSPINRQINFDPNEDAVPVLFDAYDRAATDYWDGVVDDTTRVFWFSHFKDERTDIKTRFLPRFSQVAFLVQMPHIALEEEVAMMKEDALTELDRVELEERSLYAKRWLTDYAEERFVFTLQESLPAAVATLSNEQKKALTTLADRIEMAPALDGQTLHELIHSVKEECGLDPKTFFTAIYIAFLGKESGPKVGWFLSTLTKDFLLQRLRAV